MIDKAFLQRLFHACHAGIRDFRHEEKLRAVYRRFADLTMIPESTYLDNLKLVEPYRETNGCVVECGVWRGGMIGGMASLLGPQRSYVLCDSFEGLPKAQEIDGQSAAEWQSRTDAPDYFDNCSAPRACAEEAMNRAGCARVSILQGWFNETLPGYRAPAPIDVLRLDGDWYESTLVCLQSLFDQVRPGGIIILDDYHHWDGCTRALHDYLSRKSAPERIQSLGNICFLYKR